MEIGNKLKVARKNKGLTQEYVSEKLGISRQTLSNWENEKSYPDIVSIIEISDLYDISLDELLKGDENMLSHLKESVSTVKSNKKLIIAILINILLLILIMIFNRFIIDDKLLTILMVSLGLLSTSILFYRIIKRF